MVAGKITKVVTFGAFAEIVSGVEGLIHISELAEHHVENPREVVQQGEEVKVKIIEIDPDRRRLSLSLRRVEPDEPVKTIDLGLPGGRPQAEVPELGLSEEVFAEAPADLRGGAAGGRRRACCRGACRRRAGAESRLPTSLPPRPPSRSLPPTSRSPRPPPRTRKTGRRATAEVSRRPVLVGLTGGIGGGKSEALRAFRRHGAVTLSSDESVRLLYARDDVKRAVAGALRRGRDRPRRRGRPGGGRADRLRRRRGAALAGAAAPAAPRRGVRAVARRADGGRGARCSCTRRRRSSRSASATATTRS